MTDPRLKRLILWVLPVLWAALPYAPGAHGDYVVLESGAKLYGRIEREDGEAPAILLPNGSRLSIEAEAVAEVFDPLQAFGDALEALDPEEPEAYLALARRCSETDGAEALSERLFRLATRLAGDERKLAAQAQYELARLHLRLIEDGESRVLTTPTPELVTEELRRSLRNDPSHVEALTLLRQMSQIRLNSFEVLASVLRQYLRGDYEQTRRLTAEMPPGAGAAFEAATGVTWAAYVDAVGGHRPCNTCAGKGLVVCPRCRGRGWVACAECRGKGSVKRRLDIGGVGVTRDVRCAACGGTGRAPCPACEGRREVPCTACKGSGIVRPDPHRGDAPFIRACRDLLDRLVRWDGREPLLSGPAVLPTKAFDDTPMAAIGTALTDPLAEAIEGTVFANGRWLTPESKRARMAPS